VIYHARETYSELPSQSPRAHIHSLHHASPPSPGPVFHRRIYELFHSGSSFTPLTATPTLYLRWPDSLVPLYLPLSTTYIWETSLFIYLFLTYLYYRRATCLIIYLIDLSYWDKEATFVLVFLYYRRETSIYKPIYLLIRGIYLLLFLFCSMIGTNRLLLFLFCLLVYLVLLYIGTKKLLLFLNRY